MSDDYFSDTPEYQSKYISHVYKITSDTESSEHSPGASAQSSSPEPSSPELRNETHFPLMKLSPEIRLNVYDCLFTDLTINRQRKVANLKRYHRWQDWPDNNFTAYRNLLLTCRTIHDEAKGLWENIYIRQCCFYLWKVPELFHLFRLFTQLGEPYRHVNYVLRTQPGEEIIDRDAEFLEDEAAELMTVQPGFLYPECASIVFNLPVYHYEKGPGKHELSTSTPYEIYRIGTTKGRMFARTDFPGLELCSIAEHERKSDRGRRTRYLLMSGEIGNVAWDKYDAAAAHAKVKIYEEWQKRDYPSGCLDKADAAITWRAKAASGEDKEWLVLGGDPDADLENLQSSLGLDYWLKESFDELY